jgi:nitric oxide reductase large subunit
MGGRRIRGDAMRPWRSRKILRTNCLFWALRQWFRRGGYLVIRRADPIKQREMSFFFLILALAAFAVGAIYIGILLLALSFLTWNHWAWMSRRGRLYHFQPFETAAFPLAIRGYIQRGEDP